MLEMHSFNFKDEKRFCQDIRYPSAFRYLSINDIKLMTIKIKADPRFIYKKRQSIKLIYIVSSQ